MRFGARGKAIVLGLVFIMGIPILALALVIARDKPNYDLYSYMSLNGVVLSPSTDRQQSPAIDGRRVVWSELIDGYWQIVVIELNTGQRTQLTSDEQDHIDPSISGNIVVWWYGPLGGALYVQGVDLATGSPLFEDEKLAVRPRAGTSGVTWIGFSEVVAVESSLLFVDYETHGERAVFRTNRDVNGVVEADGVIVWHERRADDYDIYAYDLSRRVEFPIAVRPGDQAGPDIENGTVVWGSSQSGEPNDGDIYALDLATGTEMVVSARDGNEYNPRISGRFVVWTVFLGHVNGVFGIHLDAQQLVAIAIDDRTNSQPDISGRIVVWTQADRLFEPNSPSRIMMTELAGAEPWLND
jgi:outer membrane protein assembly factor BamB